MIVNSFTIIMALLLFSLTSILCSMVLSRTKSHHLWLVGICLTLSFVRCILPIEFPWATNLNIQNVYPELFSLLNHPLIGSVRVRDLICLLWFTVAGILWLRQFILILRQNKFNRSISHLKQTTRLDPIISSAAQSVRCRSKVHAYISEFVSMPIMTGLFRPIILLPSYIEDMSNTEVEYILRHELAHYERGDNWYKLAVQLFTYLLWWNPAAYLMRRSVNQWMELRSDDLACRSMTDIEKGSYSLLLLRIINFSYTKSPSIISSGFVEGFDTTYLNQRIKLLSEGTVHRKTPLLSGLIACLCIIIFG